MQGAEVAGICTVAGEGALVEQLDERVFVVAGDRAGVADPSWSVVVGCCRSRRRRRRWVAGQAGDEVLSERAEGLGACVEGLVKVRSRQYWEIFA